MCLSVLPARMSVYQIHPLLEKDIQSPGPGVKGDYEGLYGC